MIERTRRCKTCRKRQPIENFIFACGRWRIWKCDSCRRRYEAKRRRGPRNSRYGEGFREILAGHNVTTEQAAMLIARETRELYANWAAM